MSKDKLWFYLPQLKYFGYLICKDGLLINCERNKRNPISSSSKNKKSAEKIPGSDWILSQLDSKFLLMASLYVSY